jgi:peroxiredoxin
MKHSFTKTIQLAIAALIISTLIIPSAMALSIEEGDMAPDFEIGTVDGSTTSLSAHKGKVVLLAFWASWCPRCMEELAFLQELYSAHKDKLTVLAINQDTKNLSQAHRQKLKDSVAELGLEFPVLIDLEFDAWQKYGINALPTSIIVDPEGKVVFAEPNYYWASQKKIKNVLAEMGIGRHVED